MKTKQIWANLGVDDLHRTTKFYSEIGFKSNGSSDELTSFSVGEDDFIIHFFLKDILKRNTGLDFSNNEPISEVIFTLSAESKEEVNKWEQAVRRAGGNILSPSREFGAGYYGFIFSDPDGHKFNVFYM